ncbi:MAG: 3-coathanger stack domain-containing protein, partial [Bacteroidota bacterium]
YDAGGAVFAHEFGHLIAMRHDPFVDGSNGPPGYSYGHGFTWTGAGDNFRTIMAYSSACSGNGGCPRISYWSNDDLQWDGTTMGNAGTSDNARVARLKETTIAAFEPQVTNKRVYTNDTVDNGEIANIIAGSSITNRTSLTNIPTTIIYQNGSKGSYIANDEITFVEGFHVKSGATFEAILESCTGNQ